VISGMLMGQKLVLAEPADGDSDGMTNLCGDPCPADPNNDSDGDGVCAPEDACPDDPLEHADADGDGLCDGDDPCPDSVVCDTGLPEETDSVDTPPDTDDPAVISIVSGEEPPSPIVCACSGEIDTAPPWAGLVGTICGLRRRRR
jgi:hypothetical protein